MPSDAEFIEAFNYGGAQHVVKLYGGSPEQHRTRASKLRKLGHKITKFKSGRPQKESNGPV